VSQGAKLDGGRELEIIRQQYPLHGALIQRIIDAVNKGLDNLGGAVGETSPPQPVDSTEVKGTLNTSTNVLTVSGEILHFVHTHNAPIQRGIRYLTEVDTDPNFTNAHAILDTTSRSGVANLPTNDDDNNPVNYYLRVTPQLPGSAPQKPTVFGGVRGPTAIQFSGTTQMSLLGSQASGTARPGQTGKGLGPVQSRAPVGGPKRNFGTK
jgi:hypothetical protein